tara:strand:- start:1580 stop:2662 length:1083 start_codon:yes stop_codon:yes gene_type:complete
MKKAIITGVTGQDGAYLAELLLSKKYEVHGFKRRSSSFNTARIEHLYQKPNTNDQSFYLHYADITDSSLINNLISDINPDEIYNLAAQSHVGVSFSSPYYTSNVNALGTLNILESIRSQNIIDKCKFYQASTSELYGEVLETPQTEDTPFNPRSPYAVSKLYSYYITKNYREAFGLFSCNGILFNHESPIRGETFVTRKITRSLARISQGLEDILYLGNLDAKRDWGHAKDYVRAQWLILQHNQPDDYVIATGKQYSVREFIEKSANYLGTDIEWRGKGTNEVGINKNTGEVIIKIDKQYFRPTDVESLIGNSNKAQRILNWKSEITIDQLIKEMIDHDLNEAKKEILLDESGLNYRSLF